MTSPSDVDAALYLAEQKNILFATFGDMLRVPGSRGESLQRKRASGADVRVIASAADCLELARSNPGKEVAMMGIGFETTSPTVAATVEASRRQGITNFSVFSVHKTVPPVLRALIACPDIKIDGFICPGHVSTIIGSDAYSMIPEAGMAAVITGFEPVDILEGIWMILEQVARGRMEVAVQYSRGVRPQGNARALELMHRVFQASAAEWRGIGKIEGSGLAFRGLYSGFDAREKYAIPDFDATEPAGCKCGDVLRGIMTPERCPLFRTTCSPGNPVGPCMVSTEGTCAAYFKFY